MRSPWRFLADLASRQPKDQAPEEAPKIVPSSAPTSEPEGEREVTPAQAVTKPSPDELGPRAAEKVVDSVSATASAEATPLDETVAEPSNEVSPIGKSPELVAPTSRQGVQKSAGSKPERSSASKTPAQNEPVKASAPDEKMSIVPGPDTSLQIVGKSKRQSVATKKADAAIGKKPAVGEIDRASRSPSSRDPMLAEMERLDADVQNLRIVLGDKLKLQNEHLRKLLKRFDRA